jgi:hypothetical protein
VIEFQSAAQASGIVTGHGEFAHPDGLTVGAYRWYDDYMKTDGRWVFARRDHKYMYALTVAAIAGVGARHDADARARIGAYGGRVAARPYRLAITSHRGRR